MRAYLFALAVVFAAGSASAQAPVEKFVFQKPDSFVLFNSVGSNTFYNAEYVPDGEQRGGVWKTRVMLQAFHDGESRDPAAFNTEMATRFSQSCPKGLVENVPVEGAVMTVMSCAEPASYRVLKTMQGAETFYLIQYEFRFPPNDSQIQAAQAYLDGVKLCLAGSSC